MFTLILVQLCKWFKVPPPKGSIKYMLIIEGVFWLAMSPEIIKAVLYYTSR